MLILTSSIGGSEWVGSGALEPLCPTRNARTKPGTPYEHQPARGGTLDVISNLANSIVPGIDSGVLSGIAAGITCCLPTGGTNARREDRRKPTASHGTAPRLAANQVEAS